jgi:hypothetical protein
MLEGCGQSLSPIVFTYRREGHVFVEVNEKYYFEGNFFRQYRLRRVSRSAMG